jgi:hypothetical protein
MDTGLGTLKDGVEGSMIVVEGSFDRNPGRGEESQLRGNGVGVEVVEESCLNQSSPTMRSINSGKSATIEKSSAQENEKSDPGTVSVAQ